MRKSMFVLVLLLVVSLLSLTGCVGSKSNDSKPNVETDDVVISEGVQEESGTGVVEESTEPIPMPEPAPAPEPATGSEVGDESVSDEDSLVKEEVPVNEVHKFETQEDFVVKIDGKEHMLPVSLDAFEGWVLNDTEGELKANQYAIGYSLKKDGYTSIGITPYNDTSVDKAVTDCVVGSISMSKSLGSASKNLDIELPMGITLGSSYLEVITSYGEPTKDTINSSNPALRSLVYEIETYKSIRLDFSNDLVTELKIQYID